MEPLVPDYDGPCVTGVIPGFLGPGYPPAWMPEAAVLARRIVVLVVDGLGWNQLQERAGLVGDLASMDGIPIHTVAPTTTATALTSITTGAPSGEHGLVGYRFPVAGRVLNSLRWQCDGRDARREILPADVQRLPPFLGHTVPVLSRNEFASTGFTGAHLAGSEYIGYRSPSSLPVDVRGALESGAHFIYAYYDGLDRISHGSGLGAHYDAELRMIETLVGDIISVLESDTALVVLADHGQVDVGDRVLELGPSIDAMVGMQSGEGRFRWLHARAGRATELLEAADEQFGHVAWVRPVERIVDEGWFGADVAEHVVDRLGDVALVAREPVAFLDPAEPSHMRLVTRHGSMTPDEVIVPLLVATGV